MLMIEFGVASNSDSFSLDLIYPLTMSLVRSSMDSCSNNEDIFSFFFSQIQQKLQRLPHWIYEAILWDWLLNWHTFLRELESQNTSIIRWNMSIHYQIRNIRHYNQIFAWILAHKYCFNLSILCLICWTGC